MWSPTGEDEIFDSDFQSTDEEADQEEDADKGVVDEDQQARKVCTTTNNQSL